jgi:hypothetical protein
LQLCIIPHLDLGTPGESGYITPFSLVCKAWCHQIRDLVYRRCNLRKQECADWFLRGIRRSVVPIFADRITVLCISFIPVHLGYYMVRDGSEDLEPKSFWMRLADAAAVMRSLQVLCICYSNEPIDCTIFGAYSNIASAFSTSLRTLILRPLKDSWVSISCVESEMKRIYSDLPSCHLVSLCTFPGLSAISVPTSLSGRVSRCFTSKHPDT